jgi:hypothetical protein
MLVALIVVVSLGAIQTIEDNGEERLEASDERISADDDAFYPGGSVTTSTVATTTTAPAGAIEVHLAANPSINVTDDGNRWQVTITFTLLDEDGDGVIGATMNGSWTAVGQGSVPVSTCTTSTGAGQCTVQFSKIKDTNDSVTYSLSSISGGTFTWVPSGPGEGEVVVDCGTFC